MVRALFRTAALVIACGIAATACTSPSDTAEPDTAEPDTAPSITSPATRSPSIQPLPEGAEATVDAYVERVAARIYDPINLVDPAVIERLGKLHDPRLAWLVADGLRFIGRGDEVEALVEAGSALSGLDLDKGTAWLELNNHLLATDVEAPPGYAAWKRELFIAIDATWAPFFDDGGADIDWRYVTFGGVLADRRPFGSTDTCQCIAALDDPPAAAVDEVEWLDDGDAIIGLVVGDEVRAYPLHIMETHELVNDTIDGQRVTLAYCTLCGSGQAYRLDDVPPEFQPVVLRTSGLLNRSNKIMFDLGSRSMVDTFTGEARTGPWREAGITLDPITTVTSRWGEWRAEHPDTTVMTGIDGSGPDYPKDPLGGRDDGGPIFPIGELDPRLFPQTEVIGVTAGDGMAVAFPAVAARDELREGREVELGGVSLVLDGSGLRAVDADGADLVSHQAFWFAWSQFNPETALWDGS